MEFKIKEARQAAGISQRDLAARLGISPPTLSGYENGSHDPKSDLLSEIADICDVSVDFLLGRSAESEQKTSPSASEPTQEDAARKLDVNEVINSFIAAGMVEPGEDLTDEDLRFLISIIDAIRSWFAQKEQQGR